MARPPKIRKSGRLTAAEKKRHAGRQVSHAKAKPHQRRKRGHDPFDAMQDARSEARYADDPQAEPDTGEVKDTAARMGQEATESPAERLIYRG